MESTRFLVLASSSSKERKIQRGTRDSERRGEEGEVRWNK